MTPGVRLRWWGVGGVVALGLVWLLHEAMAPFIAGAAIAYLMDPLVERLAKRRVPRVLGALLAIALAVLAVAAIFLLLVPVIISQLGGLLERIPVLIEHVRVVLAKLTAANIGGDLGATLATQISDTLRNAGPSAGAGTLKAAVAGGIAVFDAVTFAVVTPVVGYYLLVDWQRILMHVDTLLPRDSVTTVREIASKIDGTLAAFVRGQLLVCTVLAIFYASALSVIGLEYAVAIGVAAGLVSFIPYVGTVIGFGLSGGIALFQFYPEFVPIGLTVGTFMIGQLLESYVLTPRLVGRSVGLHPAWLLFALFAGGQLFGFTGLLVAVPTAAAIGVLVRHAEQRYRQGRFYQGESGGVRINGEDQATGASGNGEKDR